MNQSPENQDDRNQEEGVPNGTGSSSVSGKTFLDRYSTLILCVSLFLCPLIVFGAVKSLKVEGNEIRKWLPSGFEEAETHDWFVSHFGVDEMVVATWEGCELKNEGVRIFEKALSDLQIKDIGIQPGVGAHESNPVFRRVMSGPSMIDQIGTLGVSKSKAKRRVQGLSVGPDGNTTCIIAIPNPDVSKHRKEIVNKVYELAQSTAGIEPADLKLGGPTVDGAAINAESQRSLQQYLWISVLVVFLLTWFRLRDLPLSLIVLFFSVLCALVSLTILFWTGGKMNLTMVMLPTLTFILSVSACIHMVNYYRKASTMGYGLNSANQALKDAFVPVMLSSVTTAIGLISLTSSKVMPIRMFGFYAGVGIVASLPIILLIVPAVLHFMRGRISRFFGEERITNQRQRQAGLSKSTIKLVHVVCRNHLLVVIPSLIFLAVVAIGITRLTASVKLQSRFADRTKIIQDYRWMEEKLGPLVPMEVVIRVGKENQLSRWDQMQMVQLIEQAIKQTTDVNATLSAATFEPTVKRGNSLRSKLQRRTVMNRWNDEFSQLESANLVRILDDENLWRISLRVAALNEIDYGGFLETVDRNVRAQLSHLKQEYVSAEITGAIPLVYKAQHQILYDLMTSFCTAFIFISLILIFVLKSVRAGLIAMIPNIFPPLIVFGLMGWMGRAIEIGSVMTASVALGIAVDDTVHFLTWFRRGTLKGMSRIQAIRYAYDHCAKAMIDTSVICGLGVAPFIFSAFMPTVRFARLLLTLLFTALLGDLILLPAILAGPAGALFRVNKKRKRESNVESDVEDVEESPELVQTP